MRRTERECCRLRNLAFSTSPTLPDSIGSSYSLARALESDNPLCHKQRVDTDRVSLCTSFYTCPLLSSSAPFCSANNHAKEEQNAVYTTF